MMLEKLTYLVSKVALFRSIGTISVIIVYALRAARQSQPSIDSIVSPSVDFGDSHRIDRFLGGLSLAKLNP